MARSKPTFLRGAAAPRRHAVRWGVLALYLSATCMAEAVTLQALLHLPLERLLQLQIRPPPVDRSGNAR